MTGTLEDRKTDRITEFHNWGWNFTGSAAAPRGNPPILHNSVIVSQSLGGAQ